MSGGQNTNRLGPRFALLVAVSLAVHLVVVPQVVSRLGLFAPAVYEAPVAVHVIDGDPLDALSPDQLAELIEAEAAIEPKPEEKPEEPEPEEKLPDGQVVETPPPDEEKKPLDADYLAEHDNAVKEETRTDRFKVNPDVLSNQYSEESKLQFEDAIDVGAKEKSSGATVGNLSQPQPGRGPPSSLLPSQWQVTNKEGLAAPTIASSREQSLAGAPQNDLLNEKKGDAVALNTREFVGAAYMNRIRRAVNFYWQQNLDNLSSGVRLAKPRYATVVDIVLTGDGALETITVTDPSGVEPIDLCVVDAFKVAGPFPNPPEALVKKDGRVYLSDFDFEVQLGQAHMQYQGIDPRAGVQFPGIMKAPR